MAFNPALPYETISGGEGPAVYLQDGIYYERDGTVVDSPPASTQPKSAVLLYNPDGSVGSVGDGKGVVAAVPQILHFPDFYPSIMASLVSGATYAQSGSLVTVTATAHGLPSNRDGYRIFWPGSAAIPAGWYFGFEYVDANTFTFQNPTPQTLAAGTAITGTLPYVTQTALCSLTLPGGSMVSGSAMRAIMQRSGDALAASKITSLFIDNQVVSASFASTSSSFTAGSMSVFQVLGNMSGVSVGAAGMDGTANTAGSGQLRASDPSVDRVVSMRLQLAQASQWVALDATLLEIIK